jgi:hypothetical protein
MQLKKARLKKIRGQMVLATCALLQVTAPGSHAAEGDWDIDTAVLYYGEGDGRTHAFEPAISASRDLGDGERLSLRMVVDVLSGATPNGAHASTVAQTFTNPSGNGEYTVQPGEVPMNNTFRDSRVALGVDWEKPIDRMSKIIWGASLSGEYDYLSLGASATYVQDINNRNTTLTAGVALSSDTIEPVGSVPDPFTPMRTSGAQNRLGVDDTKTITELMLGITQVISRKTLMQLNFTYGKSDGYLNDYNKVLTVIDPGTDEPLLTDWVSATPGNLPYLYEKRPDVRTRNALFFKTVHHLEEDVINFSYRYFWDDWDITSHTFDMKYRYEMDAGKYLQPHIRYYIQDAADFYKHDLVQGADVDAAGNVLVKYASSDYRLAEFNSITLGLKYGFPVSDTSEFSTRAEIITQSTNDGNVRAGEETPDLTAFVIQANYSFKW